MATNNTSNAAELEAAVNLFYDKVKSGGMNYYQLLGIPTNATQRDIDAAYKNFTQEFSTTNVALLTDNALKSKAQFLISTAKRAYEVLCDFDKRGQYEKLGYQDVDPETLKEEDPVETAKEIYRKAKTLFQQKRYVLAVKGMEEAIGYDSTRPDYYLLLGKCQSQVPELRRKAETNLLKASQMESWNAEPYAAIGMLYYSERLLKRAETYFRKALELDANHVQAKNKLRELAGPEVKTMDKVQEKLGKIFPSFFGKKKK